MDTAIIKIQPMTGSGGNYRARKQAERGFSLIEVLISMTVLTVGLVGLLSVFGVAIAATQTTQQDMIAKQLANEAYESIITARNSTQIGWDDVQNVGSTYCPLSGVSPCGIFQAGTIPIYLPPTSGKYAGIVGTNSTGTAQTLREPGPNGNYGDVDDIILPLTNYQRSIVISQLNDASNNLITSLRSVTIIVTYSTPQRKTPKTYILNAYISQYP
jgi:prepilin-type N-terminal cleavage/methylation domain-containing protein